MSPTATFLTSFVNSARAAAGVEAPAANRLVLDPKDLNPNLGEGFALRSTIASEFVTISPGVCCRFNGDHDTASLRILTDPLVADGDRVRTVLQRMASESSDHSVRFDPAFNAHTIKSCRREDLIRNLRSDAEAPGGQVSARLAHIIERGPRYIGQDD